MRILIVTDAWYPQINGVVRTLDTMRGLLTAGGDEVRLVSPKGFRSLPCPTYPEIRLALAGPGDIAALADTFRPNAIHIATEGPLGLAARRYCVVRGLPFTSAFHTRFPEYVAARFRIPADAIYPLMRWFHARSSTVMAPTPTVVDNLHARRFRNVRLWGRGVDTELFRPGPAAPLDARGPVLLYVGRVAVEKNIAAFLDLETIGTKVVVGDGPMLGSLRRRYPETVFVGAKHGADLIAWFNTADVFVFPSRTDTFGLVMLEALACGVPVAAYPVMGPCDVITDPRVGCLDANLARAVDIALAKRPDDCRNFALDHSWRKSAETFRSYLHFFESGPDHAGIDVSKSSVGEERPAF